MIPNQSTEDLKRSDGDMSADLLPARTADADFSEQLSNSCVFGEKVKTGVPE